MDALLHSLALIAKALDLRAEARDLRAEARDLRADIRNLQSALAWNKAMARALCGQGERLALYEQLVEQQQRYREALTPSLAASRRRASHAVTGLRHLRIGVGVWAGAGDRTGRNAAFNLPARVGHLFGVSL